MAMPDHTRVVVVGGGIVGASVLYHLAKEGWTDALLIEKAEFTSGSTWHAAGQVTHSVSSYTLAFMRKYATELYAALEAETGVATSWHETGSFRVAYEPIEVDWLKGQLGVGAYAGLEMDWVGPEVVAEHHPLYDVSNVVGASGRPGTAMSTRQAPPTPCSPGPATGVPPPLAATGCSRSTDARTATGTS